MSLVDLQPRHCHSGLSSRHVWCLPDSVQTCLLLVSDIPSPRLDRVEGSKGQVWRGWCGWETCRICDLSTFLDGILQFQKLEMLSLVSFSTFCLFHPVFCFLLFHPLDTVSSYSKLNSPLSVSPSCSSLLVFTSFSPPPSPPPSLLLPLTWAWGTMMNGCFGACGHIFTNQIWHNTCICNTTKHDHTAMGWYEAKWMVNDLVSSLLDHHPDNREKGTAMY